MNIGIDCDGVLSSFEHGYVPILSKLTGLEFPDLGKETFPATWDYDLDAGATPAQVSEAWLHIKANPSFWLDLPPHPDAEAFLAWLSHEYHHVYFITNRTGINPKWQTEEWLARHGFPYAAVFVTAKKGDACRALHIDLYIDDKFENCQDVVLHAPSTSCFMRARPYNRPLKGTAARGDLSAFKALIEQHSAIYSPSLESSQYGF